MNIIEWLNKHVDSPPGRTTGMKGWMLEALFFGMIILSMVLVLLGVLRKY